MFETIIRWLGPVFIGWGYWVIGAAILLERSVLVGLVVPGDLILALGGIYAARAELDLGVVVGIGTGAAVVGESIGYWLGRIYGERLVKRLPFSERLERGLEWSRDHFRRWGGATVAIGRFATAAGAAVPLAAGASGMSFLRFLAFDLPAIAVWATGIAGIGYLFGRQLELVEDVLSRFGWGMLAVLLGFVAVTAWRRRGRRRRPPMEP